MVIKCLVVVVWFYDLPIGLCDTVQSPEVRGVFSTIWGCKRRRRKTSSCSAGACPCKCKAALTWYKCLYPVSSELTMNSNWLDFCSITWKMFDTLIQEWESSRKMTWKYKKRERQKFSLRLFPTLGFFTTCNLLGRGEKFWQLLTLLGW